MSHEVLSDKVHLKGHHDFVVLDVPIDATQVVVTVYRDSWPAGPRTLACGLEISLDGMGWASQGHFETSGGPHVKRDGTTAAFSSMTQPLRWPGKAGRTLGGYIDCGKDLKTRVEVEFLTTPIRAITFSHRSVGFLGAASAQATSTTTLTITNAYNLTSTDNTFLLVGMGSSAGAADLTTSATYEDGGAGTALTEKWDTLFGSDNHNSGHYLVAPSTGTHDMTIVLAGTDDELGGGMMFFEGVDQSTPLGTEVQATATNNAPTVTVAGASSDNMMVDNLYAFTYPVTVTGGQDARWEEEGINGTTGAAGSTETSANGNVTMSYSLGASGFSFKWQLYGVEILAAAAGGFVPYPNPRYAMDGGVQSGGGGIS